MIDLKDIFPVDSIGPIIGGAVVWLGANYAFIGPEVIGPRLQEKYYAPMCEQVLETGRTAQAERERTLVEQFDRRLDEAANSARQHTQNSARGFFEMFGAEGSAYWDHYGADIGGGMASLTNGPILMQLDQERSEFLGAIETQKAEHRASIRHNTPAGYCGCVIEDALSERFDLAAYSASFRIYTPPAIRNIENGAAFDNSEACGAPPVI